MNRYQLARLMEVNALEVDLSEARMIEKVNKAKESHLRFLSCHSYHVPMVAALLKDSDVAVVAVIAYPYGQCDIDTKLFEMKTALKNGAKVIEYSVNLSLLKSKKYELLEEETLRLSHFAHLNGAEVRMILPVDILSEDEVAKLCRLCKRQGVDGVKLSSFSHTLRKEDLLLVRTILNKDVKIMVDDITSFEDMTKMMKWGSTYIASDAPENIVKEFEAYVSK